jgi:hypothetical protein
MPLLQHLCSRLSIALVLLALLAPAKIYAVSCTMQGELTDDQRNQLLQSARKVALAVESGNADAVRALTVPSVAAQFDSISDAIHRLAALIPSASITIDALYDLNASDLKSAEDQTQFFCDAPDSNLHEVFTIPGLPPGEYALALVHATGVAKPQQMGLLLMKNGGWQLAGFFTKPLEVAGHDGVWYWTRARAFARNGQKWNAHFYYAIAAYLASPVDFLSTPNMEKLAKERSDVKADGVSGVSGDKPSPITANGQVYPITDLHTDDSLGGLDLVIHYTAADVSDPVATRTRNLELMKAMLAQHPELRDGFHGLWVFAETPGHQSYGIEKPMNDIQ